MTQETQFWYLHNHNLFSQLDEEEVRTLCIISGFKKAMKNEIIYFGNDAVKRIFILKRGTMKIVKVDDEGNEITKDVINEGDLFGEIALNSSSSQEGEYAKALSDEVTICTFRVEDFEQVLSQKPSVSLKFSKKIGDKLKTLESRYTNLIFKDVRTRLLEFIRDFVKQNGIEKNGRLYCNHYLTHQDMASIIGSSRQTVTSILNQLEREGLLEYTREQLIISAR